MDKVNRKFILRAKKKVKWLTKIFFNTTSVAQMINPKKIPIIINSYNRLTYLKNLIEFLERKGYVNIVILDNQSNFQPLLAYYSTLPYKVIYLEKNWGHLALWKSNVISTYKKGFFAYTDSDVLPLEECPSNFLSYFIRLSIKYGYKKVGFGLKIDDLPNWFNKKSEVIKWEENYWLSPLEKDVYKAKIDTTFALYAPNYSATSGFLDAIRTGGVYLARHLPWYENSDKLNAEQEQYYRSSNTSTHWTFYQQKDK